MGAGFQLQDLVRDVSVENHGRVIGRGVATSSINTHSVEGSYQWPPDAPAEVPFVFRLRLLQAPHCEVEVSWPGLLVERIEDVDATYVETLISGRPGILITTRQGDTITFVYTGPSIEPSQATGFQVSVHEPDPPSAAVLTYTYLP